MDSKLQIIALSTLDKAALTEVANLLVEGFREHWSNAWPDLNSALEEVKASLDTERISRVAVERTGRILGWIGAIKQYGGNVWEIHPLVVRTDSHRQGIGRSLIRDLEKCVIKRGGLTLWVGTDDENNQTTLSQVNLYPNVWEHVANIRNLNNHPYEFYQKCGFVIVGIMPDANGVGKPDIYMAKSLLNY